MEARAAGIETVYQNLALSPALSIADNMFLGARSANPAFSAKCSGCWTARRWKNGRATS
jgi:fructose transport system ATP-binding protein